MCITIDSLCLFTTFTRWLSSYTIQGQTEKKFSAKEYCMMVLQRKYCCDVDAGIYKNIYQFLVVLDPYKEICISKVCLEVTDPIKMYVIIKAVSIHLKINIIMKSKNVWQKLLVGNEGLKIQFLPPINSPVEQVTN